MSIDKNLTAWQILSVAVRSEIDAAAFYARLKAGSNVLSSRVQVPRPREAPQKRNPGSRRSTRQPQDAPESSLMPPIGVALPAEPSVPDLFEAALKAEEIAEAYYSEAGERAEDEAGRRTLAYLGRVERSHQAMIRAELELIRKFPDYYDVEDFHIAQDLFHVGP
jgi:rubrerythrin